MQRGRFLLMLLLSVVIPGALITSYVYCIRLTTPIAQPLNRSDVPSLDVTYPPEQRLADQIRWSRLGRHDTEDQAESFDGFAWSVAEDRSGLSPTVDSTAADDLRDLRDRIATIDAELTAGYAARLKWAKQKGPPATWSKSVKTTFEAGNWKAVELAAQRQELVDQYNELAIKDTTVDYGTNSGPPHIQ